VKKAKANDIRRIREELEMTQEDFARALAVVTSTVSRWENDHTAPSRLARRAIDLLVQRRESRPTPSTYADSRA
jgi:DNA-binding transcriptional regulator YiaG